MSKDKKINNNSFAWNEIEDTIKKEIIWLKNNVPIMPQSYDRNSQDFLQCHDCLLRKIAILIVSGKVKASEVTSKNGLDLWNGLTINLNLKRLSYHGHDWHKKMMDVIYEYFKSKGNNVILEPILNYGRADLEINSKGDINSIYIEVGTVSLFKLWCNLSTMKNVIFLIIPSENKVIEFKVLEI